MWGVGGGGGCEVAVDFLSRQPWHRKQAAGLVAYSSFRALVAAADRQTYGLPPGSGGRLGREAASARGGLVAIPSD